MGTLLLSWTARRIASRPVVHLLTVAFQGNKNDNGSWNCAYPGCASKSTFNRGCDLRKHYKRHTKTLFCRQEGCPQATAGGFSSKKDRARHEAKHNPDIACEWKGCDRLFSRTDNMVSFADFRHFRQLAILMCITERSRQTGTQASAGALIDLSLLLQVNDRLKCAAKKRCQF